MRRTIYMLLIVAAVLTNSTDSIGFQDVLETPALESKLVGKSMLNAITHAGNRLIAVGWRGHIIYSDDRGKNWVQARVPVSSDLTAICFPSSRKGWVVGHDGVVLHSSDGGATWIKQLDGFAAAKIMVNYYAKHPLMDMDAKQRLESDVKRFSEEGADKPFLGIWFDNENNGFIVGSFNMIFRTTNGGGNWEPLFDRTDNPGLLNLNAIQRIGQDLFISGEQGLVMKYNRKTERFQSLEIPYKGSFFGITGKPGSAIVFGLRGNAFFTSDGGLTWEKAEVPVQVGLTGGAVMEDGRIVLVSQEGHLLISIDKGRNFHQIKVERPVPASAVVSLNKDTLVLAGLLGLKLQPLK